MPSRSAFFASSASAAKPSEKAASVPRAHRRRFGLVGFLSLASGPERFGRRTSDFRCPQQVIDRDTQRKRQAIKNVDSGVHRAALDATEVWRGNRRVDRQLFLRQGPRGAEPPHVPRKPYPSIHAGKAFGLRPLIHDLYDNNYAATASVAGNVSKARGAGRPN